VEAAKILSLVDVTSLPKVGLTNVTQMYASPPQPQHMWRHGAVAVHACAFLDEVWFEVV